MLDAWALGFALAAGCFQPLDDAIAMLAAISDEAVGLDEATSDTEGLDAAVSADDAHTLFVGHAGFEVLEKPRWVRHRVRPRERLTAIAARHGARAEDLIRWNRLDPNEPAVRRRQRVIFWIVSAFAAILMSFPLYAPLFY